MSRFVDPFTDTGFKIIFGKENKSNEILKAFLNDLFEDQPDFDPVEKLHYLNNERSRDNLVISLRHNHIVSVHPELELRHCLHLPSVQICRDVK